MKAAAIPASLFKPVPLAAYAVNFTWSVSGMTMPWSPARTKRTLLVPLGPYTFDPAGYHVVNLRETIAPVVLCGSLY